MACERKKASAPSWRDEWLIKGTPKWRAAERALRGGLVKGCSASSRSTESARLPAAAGSGGRRRGDLEDARVDGRRRLAQRVELARVGERAGHEAAERAVLKLEREVVRCAVDKPADQRRVEQLPGAHLVLVVVGGDLIAADERLALELDLAVVHLDELVLGIGVGRVAVGQRRGRGR